MAGNGWRVEDNRWRVTGGGWRITGGGWREYALFLFQKLYFLSIPFYRNVQKSFEH